jgi:hypothetical protein
VLGEVHLVDLRRDSPDRAALAVGDPGSPAGVLEEVVARGKSLALLDIQRGNPGRISGVETVRQGQEIAQAAAPGHHLQCEL